MGLLVLAPLVPLLTWGCYPSPLATTLFLFLLLLFFHCCSSLFIAIILLFTAITLLFIIITLFPLLLFFSCWCYSSRMVLLLYSFNEIIELLKLILINENLNNQCVKTGCENWLLLYI
jgi:hypothetical protein